MSPVKLGFAESDNATVFALYQALIKQGIAPEAMDKGYTTANYLGRICPEPAERVCRLGANDGILAPQEVMDYALEASETDETLRRVVEGTLHRPVPWALDDLDPKTTEDAALREELAQETQTLRDILVRQGMQKGSPEYQERLAMGLFYFALVPNKDAIEKMGKTKFFSETQELEGLDLFEWTQHLYQRGGWGLTDNRDAELTALESLKYRQGKCTEKAKILYAVLRHAGFATQFVYVNPSRTNQAVFRKEWARDPTLHHVCVGISTPKGLRLLDTSMFPLAQLHREYYPLSKREFWAFDLNNRAVKLNGNEAAVGALDLFNVANSLDPKQPLVLYNRAPRLANVGKLVEAQKDFATAHQFYPLTEFSINSAHIFAKMGDFDSVKAVLKKIIARFPSWDKPFLHLAEVHSAQKNFEEADEDYTKLIDRLPKNANPELIAQYHLERGKVRFFNEDFETAMKDVNTAIQKTPGHTEARILRSNLYIKKGDYQKARADYDAIIGGGKVISLVYVLRAQAWLEDHQWRKTIEDCETAIGMQEKGTEVFRLRGLARLGEMEIPGARSDLLQFQTLSTGNSFSTDYFIEKHAGLILEQAWNAPQYRVQSELFDDKTTVSLADFQTMIFMAGLLWERGSKDKAIETFNDFMVGEDPAQFKLNEVQPLVRQVLADLPKSMLQDARVVTLLKSIQ